MKKYEIKSPGFRDLTIEENHLYSGGGFAYDVGRTIRFLLIAGGGDGGKAMAVLDAVLVSMK